MQANCRVEEGKLINDVNGERYKYGVGDVLKITTECGSVIVGKVNEVARFFKERVIDEVVMIKTDFSFYSADVYVDKIVDIIPVRRG